MANRSNRFSGIPWIRIGAESTAIVLSILLAFAIDAWWDNSQDRQEEQRMLRGLQTEFEKHSDELSTWQETVADILFNLETMMYHISFSDSIYSVSRLDSALYRVIWRGTWDPSGSVLDAILSSGKLELIQHDSLRIRLSGWGKLVSEVQDDHIMNVQSMVASVWPRLSLKGTPLVRAWNQRNPTMRDLVSEELASNQYERIRGDMELLSMVATVRATWSNSQGEIDEAFEESKTILGLINGQLR